MKRRIYAGLAVMAGVYLVLEILALPPIWRGLKYKSIRQAIERGDEPGAIAAVQRAARNPVFKPDWTLQNVLPPWRWAHDLEMKLFGCPTCRGTGYTLLQLAAWNNQSRLVSELLASGASVNLRGDQGIGALGSAVGGGNTNIIATFLARGANPNATNYIGSAMHGAAGFARKLEVLEMLLAAGGDLNAPDPRGWTPLDWATAQRNTNAATFLIARGAKAGTRRHETLSQAVSASE